MEQNAFELITQKVGEALQERGFEPVKDTAEAEQGVQCAVFCDDDLAYSVLYRTEQKRFELRKCNMTDDGPDGKWKSISAWLYDAEEDSSDQLQNIVADFTDSVAGPKQKAAAARQKKKRRKDEDNNVDPIFLFNRFVGIFPELKDEMSEERDNYDDIRSVTFAREKLLPKIDALTSFGGDPATAGRCATLFNELYASGDLDVRSIITIVLLNGLSEKSIETLRPLFSPELEKAYKSGLKMKGKKVKPEKKKKASRIMASTLNDMNK